MKRPPESPATQLRNELMAVIVRYGHESDVSVHTCIGALEVVKSDLIAMLEQAGEDLSR